MASVKTLLCFVMLVSASVVQAADPAAVRSASDNAKLNAILASIGATGTYAASVRESTTSEQANDLFWQAVKLAHDDKDYAAALEGLRKVLAYDPDFEARQPSGGEKIYAFGELWWVLYSLKDWERARPAAELDFRILYLRHPQADTFGPGHIETCRKKLAEAGKPDFPPYVLVSQTPCDDRSCIVDGVVLVPASQLAEYIGSEAARDGASKVTIGGKKVRRHLTLVAGQKTAQGSLGALELPVAPRESGGDLLIPLRSVVKYLGLYMEWDPTTKIGWVSLAE